MTRPPPTNPPPRRAATECERPAFPGRRRTALAIAGVLALLIALPLAGVALTGKALDPYLELPPRPRPTAHAAFSWPAFVLVAGLVLASLTPLARGLHRIPRPPAPGAAGTWPVWGWAGAALIAGGWAAAWTRLPALAPVQSFTFLPLWFGYIIAVNGLVRWRTGQCPLADQPRRYAALFLVSAAFWWLFEYLNQFTRNWHYLGVGHFSTVEYLLWNSLAFATVLPAVTATQALIASSPRLQSALQRGWALRPSRPRRAALAALAAACCGLLVLGVWPSFTFPLLWLAPLALVVAVQALRGEPHLLTLSRGDWRGVWTWGLAAALCGVFWEMWNFYSAAKWVYSIPFVHRFEVFEMPLLGFAGYLPFGLECALAVHLTTRLAGPGPAAEGWPGGGESGADRPGRRGGHRGGR